MNGFKRICAVILGGVLFAAGVLKLMDPLGTSLIVDEYFKFFPLGFLRFASMPVGIALALLETLTGAALISGVWRKTTGIVCLCLLVFFTVVTFILWIMNPPMDCGCFGEAVHLTHLQSLLKNLALLLLWAVVFIPRGAVGKPQKVKYASFAVAAASVALFTLYSLLSIPFVDFTSLKPGTELYGAYDENFADVEGFVYEKDGREGTFTPDALPDTSWHFVRTENYDTSLGKEDENPPASLSFYSASGDYADSLALDGRVFAISAYNPEKLSGAALQNLARFASQAQQRGFTVLFLTAGTPETLAESVSDPVLLANSYFADRRLLMTLNRSNGGVTLISDALVTAKWAARALPDNTELDGIAEADPVEYMMGRTGRGKMRLQAFLLYTFAVLLLL